MTKYRRKEPALEAKQLTHETVNEIVEWVDGYRRGDDTIIFHTSKYDDEYLVLTPGKWLVRENYIFKVYTDGDFHYLFEAVDDAV